MAQVSLLTITNAGTPRKVNESSDQVLASAIEGTQAARALWNDTAATSAALATGVNVGTVQIGVNTTTVTIPGNLTVQGTTTTISTTNLVVSDALIYANDGGADPSFAGMAWDQGAALDVIEVWNPTNNRMEFGRFDTVGGTAVPAAALPTLIDVRVNNLSMAGSSVTADAGLSVTATGADLQLASTGANTVQLQTNGLTQWSVQSTGALFTPTNADIGEATQANSPSNVYAATSVVVGNTVTITSNAVTGNADLAIDTTNTLNVGTTNASAVNIGTATTTTTIASGGTLDLTGVTVVGIPVTTPTLAAVLAQGNVTGGTSLEVSAGDVLQAATGNAAFLIQGDVGGAVTVTTQAQGAGAGGAVLVSGGDGSSAGGQLNLQGGDATTSGLGGGINVTGGAGNGSAGGAVQLTGGTGSVSGGVNVAGDTIQFSNQNGAGVQTTRWTIESNGDLSAASATGIIRGTNSTSPSDLSIRGGNDTAATSGGNVEIVGGSSGGTGGGITLRTGSGITQPGQLQITTGTTLQWQVIGSNGNLLTPENNDIGEATQALSPNTIYAATSVVVGTTVTITTGAVTGSANLLLTSDQASNSLLEINSGDGIEINPGANSGSGNVTIFGVNLGTFGVGSNSSLSDFMLRIDNDAAVSLAAGASDDLTLGARGDTITLSDAGNTTLSGSYTATSIIGALNEVISIIPGSQDLAATLATGNTTGGTSISFSSGDDALWAVDGAGDVGAVGANRPGNVYAATSVVVGSTVTVTTDAVTASGALTVSATAANMIVQTVTSGTLSVNSAGELDLASAGLMDVNAGANLDVDATGTFDLLAGSTITIAGTGASSVAITSGNLSISTVTTGTLSLTSAADLDLNAATGFSIDGATASNVTVSGATEDLTLGARGATITLNETGQTTLDGSFTATSIVGALNELVASSGPATGLSTTYTNANAGAITQGQCVYISAANSVDLSTGAANNAAARLVGFVVPASIAAAASGLIQTAGATTVLMEASLTLGVGEEVFLSQTTAGSLTNAPNTAAATGVIQSVGYIKNLLSYDGAADLLVEIEIVRGPRLVLG